VLAHMWGSFVWLRLRPRNLVRSRSRKRWSWSLPVCLLRLLGVLRRSTLVVVALAGHFCYDLLGERMRYVVDPELS
jgi:hypothetical protein